MRGTPMNCELAFAGLTTDVGKAQKVKGFGWFLSAILSVLRCPSAKFDQSRFVGVQFQSILD
jgi:hypothetical protein